MNKNSNEELMWKYADGLCTEEEVKQLMALLEKDEASASLFAAVSKADMMLMHQNTETLDPLFQQRLEVKLKEALHQIDFAPVTIIPESVKRIFFILLCALGAVSLVLIPKNLLFGDSVFVSELGSTFFYNIIAVATGLAMLLYFDKMLGDHRKKHAKMHLFL